MIKKGKKFQLDCVDNNISSNKQKNLLKKNINFYHIDIMKFKLKKKYDLIIFLAGITSPTIYKNFLKALEVSYNGAEKYLEYSKKW